MFCYNCGASQPDGTTFCSNCGRSTQAPARPSAPASSAATATQPSTTTSGAASAAQPAPSVPPSGAPGAASTSPWLNVPPMAQPTGQPVYRGQPQTDGKATGSLILGILSLLCFSFLAGIPAVILGHMSRKSIRQSMGRLKGDGMALAGLIMGYISFAAIPFLLIVAAIAIPNLLRAKISANDAAAASTVRTLNTAEVTYSTTYPKKGYARELATLGSGDIGSCSTPSESNACLVDDVLAKKNVKAGFRYSLTGICGDNDICTDYVVTATPVTNATGSKTFCSTSDAVIRYKRGEAFPPSTVEECQAWPPLI
jgi:type IV pilus assembly protein PilA